MEAVKAGDVISQNALSEIMVLKSAAENWSTKVSGQTFDEEIDTAGLLQFHLRVNPQSNSLLLNLTGYEKGGVNDKSQQIVATTLSSMLRIRVNGEIFSLDRSQLESVSTGQLGYVMVQLPAEAFASTGVRMELLLGDQSFREFKVIGGEIHPERGSGLTRRLDSFDLRNIVARGDDYIESVTGLGVKPKYRPMVDLHTHFAGQVSADTLLRLAVEKDIALPVSLLRENEIQPDPEVCERDRNGQLVISATKLTAEQQTQLRDAMQIGVTEVITFQDMERLYRLRAPITKRPDLLPEMLEDIALNYKAKGVQYAELSISDIVKPDWLRAAHESLPDIESRTGVKLRFLVGLWRHSPPEFNQEMLKCVAFAAEHSPYIVGVDFMGHETNSTYAFENELRLAAELRDKYSAWQVRVHAGENPVNVENVREALRHATRIGHGLYGTDEVTLAQAKERGVIVEFNPSSNRALGNINGYHTASELPMSKYKKAGVAITLGTDGSIYQGGGLTESSVARQAGLSDQDLLNIAISDRRYRNELEGAFLVRWNSYVDRCLESSVERFCRTYEIDPNSEQPAGYRANLRGISEVARSGVPYEKSMSTLDNALWEDFRREVISGSGQGIPDAAEFPEPKFDWSLWQKAQEDLRGQLYSGLSEKGIVALRDFQELVEFIGERKPRLISGASKSSWPKISEENQEAIRNFLEELVKSWDPGRDVPITGATDFGVEKVLHELLVERNKELREKGLKEFDIIGTVVDETVPAELGPITHAISVGDKWYAKSAPVLEFLAEQRGTVVFIGGGNIISDEIQAAYNIGAEFVLMDGPEGASTDKAKIHEGLSFRDFSGYQKLLNKG